MRHHEARKNLAPSAPGQEPSTRALDSSFLPIPSLRPCPVPSLRNLCALSVSALDFSYFLAPLRPRWSSVVFQRKMPSISFFFLSLRDSFFHNDRGSTPTPIIQVHRKPGWLGTLVPSAVEGATFHAPLNSLNSFALIFLRTLLHCGFSQLLSFQSLPHSLAKTIGGGCPLSLALLYKDRRQGDLYLAMFQNSPTRTRFKLRPGEFSSDPWSLVKVLIYNNLTRQKALILANPDLVPGSSSVRAPVLQQPQVLCRGWPTCPTQNWHSRSMGFLNGLFYNYLALEFTTASGMRRRKSWAGAVFSQNSGKAEAEQQFANREDYLGSRGPTKWVKR
jgi:hypothetical protein